MPVYRGWPTCTDETGLPSLTPRDQCTATERQENRMIRFVSIRPNGTHGLVETYLSSVLVCALVVILPAVLALRDVAGALR